MTSILVKHEESNLNRSDAYAEIGIIVRFLNQIFIRSDL